MAEKKEVTERVRLWATVVYPDSAPDNWQELLADKHIACYISPLHDKDINEDGKTPKKPHYHVFLIFDSKKSREQIKIITDSFGGVGQELIRSKRGYARYLCHLDNPEKHQYPIEQVVALGGLDYESDIGIVINKYKVIAEMLDFVSINNVFYYSDLFDYARLNEPTWFRVLCDNGSFVMKEYIKSNAYKYNQQNGGLQNYD